MTKQGEIRDAFVNMILARHKMTRDEALWEALAYMGFLDSRGVVIKADRVKPICGSCEGTGMIGGPGINDCCFECNGTGEIYCVGYVATKSLIEEGL